MKVKNESKFYARNSITIKFIIIGLMILALLVPAKMIKNLIHERNSLTRIIHHYHFFEFLKSSTTDLGYFIRE